MSHTANSNKIERKYGHNIKMSKTKFNTKSNERAVYTEIKPIQLEVEIIMEIRIHRFAFQLNFIVQNNTYIRKAQFYLENAFKLVIFFYIVTIF